jgi:hypothetical protein
MAQTAVALSVVITLLEQIKLVLEYSVQYSSTQYEYSSMSTRVHVVTYFLYNKYAVQYAQSL